MWMETTTTQMAGKKKPPCGAVFFRKPRFAAGITVLTGYTSVGEDYSSFCHRASLRRFLEERDFRSICLNGGSETRLLSIRSHDSAASEAWLIGVTVSCPLTRSCSRAGMIFRRVSQSAASLDTLACIPKAYMVR